MRAALLSMIPITLLLSACLENSTGLAGGDDPEIRVRVTGGFAGVDYTILVDGGRRAVIGEECLNGCDFGAGQTLHGLSRDQVAYLSGLFLDAGVHALNGTDFGVECCDQFHYAVTYEDESGTSTVQGSSELLPPSFLQAVVAVSGFASGVYPIVVDQGTDPSSWAMDLALVEAPSFEGDYLILRVSYSGGCAVHHLDLVAFGGWMESFPVQIQSFLSHDANGDQCEAWITRDMTFDLKPLKQAYQESYGVGEPGGSTVVILFRHQPSFSSLFQYHLEYVF